MDVRKSRKKIKKLILEALLEEVYTTPKPGLVDLWDCGAHEDMTVSLFEKSAGTIAVYLMYMFVAGEKEFFEKNRDLKRLFSEIQLIGRKAEKEMFQSTDGVNTHKGAIFMVGLIAAACGYCIHQKRESDFSDKWIEKVFSVISLMTKEYVNEYFDQLCLDNAISHGDYLYLLHGKKGIRGEAAKGFPVLKRAVQSMDYWYKKMELDENQIKINVLMDVSAHLDDMNIIYRSSEETLKWYQKRVNEIRIKGGASTHDGLKEIIKLNQECIEKNISPGGAADYLAAVILLKKIELWDDW